MTPDLHIELLPKQIELGEMIEYGKASWIGYGGSRGASKSGGARRLMMERRMRHPGTWGIIIRRNSKELQRNHIDELFREYPSLKEYYHATKKELTLPQTNGSKIYFGYADTLDDVRLQAMGGQFMDVFIDQAEQFSEEELREFKQMARWPGKPVGSAKMLLLFNMGGAGIQFLKRVFHTKEFHDKEEPSDFAFLAGYAWDNVFWVLPALVEDGISITEYYSWTDKQREEYCLNNDAKSDYISNLNRQDESLRQRDLYGSWESFEGAYFGSVWDRNKAVISQDQIQRLAKPWWKQWMSLDWGRNHFAANYWHTRGVISPQDALDVLGWPVSLPVNLTITRREHVARQKSELDYAREIIELTPEEERRQLKAYFCGHDIFGERSSQNTIAQQIDSIFIPAGFPRCEMADLDRKGGASLMYNLLLESKRMAATNEECWLIGAGCPELIDAIPALMRDPDNLEDVKKTDSSTNPLDDVYDGCFVADTEICTQFGLLPISEIVEGFRQNGPKLRVFTRAGLALVTNAWYSGYRPIVKARFSDGTLIKCTPDHKFFTDRGFIRLDELRYSDKLESWNQSHLKGASILSSTVTGERVNVLCTEMFGLRTLARSLRSTIFTTLTEIARTTQLKTCSASSAPTTCVSMGSDFQSAPITWQEFRNLPRTGIDPRKGEVGTANMPSPSSSSQKMPHVDIAEFSFNPRTQHFIADQPVNKGRADYPVLTTWIKTALFAVRSLLQTVTTNLRRADSDAVRLLGFSTAGYADVYDIEVEHGHEFYANGLLVHNCRYGLKSMLSPRIVAPASVRYQEQVNSIPDFTQRHLASLAFKAKERQKHVRASWRN